LSKHELRARRSRAQQQRSLGLQQLHDRVRLCGVAVARVNKSGDLLMQLVGRSENL